MRIPAISVCNLYAFYKIRLEANNYSDPCEIAYLSTVFLQKDRFYEKSISFYEDYQSDHNEINDDPWMKISSVKNRVNEMIINKSFTEVRVIR